MAEVLRANPLSGGMKDRMEALSLTNSFVNLSMTTSVQGQHQGAESYVIRLPRKAFSCTDQPPIASQAQKKHTRRRPAERYALATAPSSLRASPAVSPFPSPRLSPQPNRAIIIITTTTTTTTTTTAAGAAAATRPAIPSPQRSYSVMDVEPVPFTHQPGTALTLPDLPAELHYAIFDFLDPIDSTCLGLTSRQFYAAHRRLHGTVSLGARREGPNDMEWVWRHAGPFVSSSSSSSSSSGGGGGRGRSSGGGRKHNALAVLSPRGQVYCRKCRTARCELHMHIREWFAAGGSGSGSGSGGAKWEYCEVSQKFGRPAEDGAKPVCHRSSPRHPHRCGRHTRQQRAVRLT